MLRLGSNNSIRRRGMENHQAISRLAEKGVTAERAAVEQKLNMNRRRLAIKKKANAMQACNGAICKAQKLIFCVS